MVTHRHLTGNGCHSPCPKRHHPLQQPTATQPRQCSGSAGPAPWGSSSEESPGSSAGSTDPSWGLPQGSPTPTPTSQPGEHPTTMARQGGYRDQNSDCCWEAQSAACTLRPGATLAPSRALHSSRAGTAFGYEFRPEIKVPAAVSPTERWTERAACQEVTQSCLAAAARCPKPALSFPSPPTLCRWTHLLLQLIHRFLCLLHLFLKLLPLLAQGLQLGVLLLHLFLKLDVLLLLRGRQVPHPSREPPASAQAQQRPRSRPLAIHRSWWASRHHHPPLVLAARWQ